MGNFLQKMREKQQGIAGKYKLKQSSGGMEHLLQLTDGGDQKTVDVSILPPKLDDIELFDTNGSAIVVAYRYVYIDGTFFRLKGGKDDPISEFLWNRYEAYKDNGLDTSGIDTPVTRYATIVWCHSSSVEDEAGKPHIVLLPKSVNEEILEIEDSLPDGTSVFGVVDVAKLRISYKKKAGQRFGRYSTMFTGSSNVVEDEDDFERLLEDIKPVAEEFEMKISKHDFSNYDKEIERFVKLVGLGEWNKYSMTSVQVAASDEDIDDEIPGLEEAKPKAKPKAKQQPKAKPKQDVEVDDLDVDDIMKDLDL